MGKKKTLVIVLLAVLVCAVFYFMTNQLTLSEQIQPEEIRVIHTYHEVPGASSNTLSDEDIADPEIIKDVMDELEGTYLRIPVSRRFYRNEKNQHELCISWLMGHNDIDIRSNGRVVINGEPYLRLDDGTDDLYKDLLEILK